MRRVALAVGLLLVGAVASWPAAAQSTAPARGVPASASAALPALPAPAAAPSGLAVVALGGTMDAAWPLAHAVYGQPSLRPPAVDEARARVLCGEPAPAGASPEVRDIADVVTAVKGDDAASRALLAELAHRLGVRALVVVRGDPQHPVARVFLPEAGVFDAASYTPDEGAALAWTGATQSLVRLYGGATPPAPPATALPAPTSAPPLATHDEPVLTTAPPKRKAFYESGWFWGALGAAAFAGGAVFFATRDNGASTIHLQMQVPH
jgi:hypothetical protein